MNTPRIQNHIWYRHIPRTWVNASGCRTDIPTRVLENPNVIEVHYALDDGRTIIIPMDDLRHAVAGAPRRMYGRIIGPFSINPFNSSVHGCHVPLTFTGAGPDRISCA